MRENEIETLLKAVYPYPFQVAIASINSTPLPAGLNPDFSTARNQEFLIGRTCAENALQRFGVNGTYPLASSSIGAPVWPLGYAGSITHKNSLAIASVIESSNFSIGIDLEEIEASDLSLEKRILTPFEISTLADAKEFTRSQIITMAFSAKEAFFKAVSPLLNSRDLDFKDIELGLNLTKLEFEVRIISEDFYPYKGKGKLLVSQNLIFSIAIVSI